MIISGNSGINSANKVYGADSVKVGKGVRNTTATAGAKRSDEVVLSSEAQGLQQKIAAIKALPDVREDRIRELAPKVESGQYRVDAAKIADQMIGRILADRLK